MLLEQRIQKLCRLSDSEKAIGELLLERRYDLKNLSTRDIASLTYTSSATVVRFAQKLGYKGFNDLKEDYLAELHYLDTHFRRVDANFPFDKQDNTLEVAGKLNALLKETLDDTLSLVDGHMLQRVTQLFKLPIPSTFLALAATYCSVAYFNWKCAGSAKKWKLRVW